MDTMICSIHQKKRTRANLEEMGNGMFKCKPENPCQMGGGGGHTPLPPGVKSSRELAAAGHTIIHPEQSEVCFAHGKRRSPAQLYQVRTSTGPQWECVPESRCKVSGEGRPAGAADPQRALQAMMGGAHFSPYGVQMDMSNAQMMGMLAGRGGMPGMAGFGRQAGMGGNLQMCSVHNKRRTMSSLEMGPDGRYQCTAADRCKVRVIDPSTVGTCTIHGKQRRLEYLAKGADGNLQCAEGHQCQ